MLEGYSKLAAEEEDVLQRGYVALFPLSFTSLRIALDGVKDFLASLNCISEAQNELMKHKLDFCSGISGRLTRLVSSGLQSLLKCFRSALEEQTGPGEELPETVAENLKLIAGFALAAPDRDIYDQLLCVYADVRGSLLRKNLSSPFSVLREDLAGPGTGNYQRGSHPYIQTLEQMLTLLQAEQQFAMQVLPSPAEGLARASKGVAEDWLLLTQSLCGIVTRGLERGEWAEQVFLLDLVSAFSKSRPDLASLLDGSFRVLVGSAGQVLDRVRRDVEQEGRQSSAGPPPANATAMELTGSLLSLLRRMAEYGPVAEALLSRDSPMAPLPALPEQASLAQLPLLSAYYQNSLRWLEAAIELRAKGYKKPVVGLVFRLNNYRYIQRVISQSLLSELLSEDTRMHYQQVLQQLKDQYAATWRALARLLNPAEPLPGSLGLATSKDRARVFINEVTEAVKLQSALSVPDQEFRSALRDLVKSSISEPFDEFYSKYCHSYIFVISFHFSNTTVFLAMASKGALFDKDVLATEISKLFSAS